MIKEAAIKVGNKIYTGYDHSSIMNTLFKELKEEKENFDEKYNLFMNRQEGFVTEDGTFLSRGDAAVHAYSCGQIKTKKYQLTSIDINYMN